MDIIPPYADFYVAIHFTSGAALIPSTYLDRAMSSGHKSIHYDEVSAYAL